MSYKEICSKYPEIVNKGRKGVEANVLGCLYSDLILIEEYKIKNSDFISEEGKLYFDIACHLFNKKIIEPTDTDIRLLLSDELIQDYKKLGGFKRIEQLKKMVDTNNFIVYLDDLYKKNLYMSYIDDGLDLEKKISIDTKNKKIEISYLDLFEGQNMNSEEIVQFMQNRNANKDIITFDKTIEEEDGYISEDFLDNLDDMVEMGIMLDHVGEDVEGNKIKFLPGLSKETLGVKRGTLNMLASFVNVGKTALLTNKVLSLVNKGERCLVITNEQKVKHFKMSFLVFVASQILKEKSITKKRLKKGKFTDKEKEILNKARLVYNERFADKLKLCSIPDSNIDMVNKFVRKYCIGKGFGVLVYDTFKMEVLEGSSESTYKDLISDSRKLEIICKNNNLIGLAAIQLSQVYLGNLVLDISMLSGAKAINEVLSDLYMMRSVYNSQELDKKNEKYYIEPFIWEKDQNGRWKKKTIEIEKNGVYRVLFLTKTRDGQTFTDSNEAFLLRYFGEYGVFKEICYCTPKRRIINENKY